MKKVLVCDGDWLLLEDGNSRCSGALTASPIDELGRSGLTIEERKDLQNLGLGLFVTCFVILAMKKAIIGKSS